MTSRKGRGTLELPLTPPLGEGAVRRARRTCAMFARNKTELLLFLRQLDLLPEEQEGGDTGLS